MACSEKRREVFIGLNEVLPGSPWSMEDTGYPTSPEGLILRRQLHLRSGVVLQSRRHGLHLHHHVMVVGGQGVGVGRVRRLLLGHLLLSQSHLVVLVSHPEVVGNSWSVPSAGWERVVVRPRET